MIIQENFDYFLKKQFVIYAQDVVWNRAVPDVRDGLKPVQRRILESMLYLGLHPTKPYKKCARTVGDCLGRLHPHGDTSVYGAMVTLAQDFGMRYPLIDGHGNFGSTDGDSAAAMRYTEARLSRIGELMLQDIDKDTIDEIPNYDESETEASVLPSKFPNLLTNGNVGIAVGMASSFAPHNASSVYEAADTILSNMASGAETDDDDIIDIIKAPDFPTGGIIINPEDLREAYKNGRGRVIIQSKYTIEDAGRGKQSIVVTEIPYGVNKKNLVNSIADLSKETIPDITEVRDESSREGTRIIIELKKGSNVEWVLNNLFKRTKLVDGFSLNHVALVDGHPQMNISLKNMVQAFVDHCIEVNTRKITYDLSKLSSRKHIVDAIMIILDNLDEAIELIRNSGNKQETINALMEAYSLDEVQANAVTDMRLWSFNKEGIEKYANESNELSNGIETCNLLLENFVEMIEYTRNDLKTIKDKYFAKDNRITDIDYSASLLKNGDDARQFIKDEDIVITLSHNGIIKSVKANDYSTQKRGGKGVNLAKKDDDFIEQIISPLSTHDDLVIAMDTGRIVMLPAYKIPVSTKAGAGKYLQNYIKLNEGEKIISVLGLNRKNNYDGIKLLMVSRYGNAKRMSLDSLPKTSSGVSCMNFNKIEGDSLITCSLVHDNDSVISITALGMGAKTDASLISTQGRNAGGVSLMKFKYEDDYIVSAFAVQDDTNFIVVTENGLGSVKKPSDFTTHKRGSKGSTCTKITERSGLIAKAIVVKENEDLFVTTYSGKIIRTPAADISIGRRGTAGVKMINLGDDDYVKSIAVVAVNESEGEKDAESK